MHKTTGEMRQKQVEESGAEIKKLHEQLTSLQEACNGYKLANEQSTNDKAQLETSLVEVKGSLNHTNKELSKVNAELHDAKRKHNDHEMLARRVLAKYGERIREAREVHLVVKYGLLWRLRMRAKTSVLAATTVTDVPDEESESERSDDGDGEEPEDTSTPDINAGEERNAEEEKSREQDTPDEGNTTNEKETIEEEQKSEQEREIEHKETADQEISTEGASSISQDRQGNGNKGGKDGRKQRGMKSYKRKQLIEEGKLSPWRDPAWIDPDTGLPSNGKPPKRLRDQWAAEKAQKKEGESTKAKPADTKQNMLPATAPRPPPGAPTAPRAMIADGLQGPQPPTEPKAMRNDTHGQNANPKSGFLPPHLRHKQIVNKPVPSVQPDSFNWANQSLAQSTQQEAELQNQAALTDLPQPLSKPKYTFLHISDTREYNQIPSTGPTRAWLRARNRRRQ